MKNCTGSYFQGTACRTCALCKQRLEEIKRMTGLIEVEAYEKLLGQAKRMHEILLGVCPGAPITIEFSEEIKVRR